MCSVPRMSGWLDVDEVGWLRRGIGIGQIAECGCDQTRPEWVDCIILCHWTLDEGETRQTGSEMVSTDLTGMELIRDRTCSYDERNWDWGIFKEFNLHLRYSMQGCLGYFFVIKCQF